jgi:hypothetical protein
MKMGMHRVRTLLRFSYAHVQLMLYRPFLHYASPKLSTSKQTDERCYACAAAAITVSRNIVNIGIEIQKQATLIGPYWFALYTQFFAILSLVFYVLENPDKPGSTEILADARDGSEVIAGLSHRSLAAERITDALSVRTSMGQHRALHQANSSSRFLNNYLSVSGRSKGVPYPPRNARHRQRSPALVRDLAQVPKTPTRSSAVQTNFLDPRPGHLASTRPGHRKGLPLST